MKASPLNFISDAQWASLCKKYKVNINHKPRRLGSGISAEAFTFGEKLVIKSTTCSDTIAVAKKVKRKSLNMVAKVFEVIRTSRACDSYYNNAAYFIIQERLAHKRSAKVSEFCETFEGLCRAMGDFSNNDLKEYVNMAFELKRCGFNLKKITDLHDSNVYTDKKGKIKIIDLGCLNFNY